MSDVFELTHFFFDKAPSALDTETRFAVFDGDGQRVGTIFEPDLTRWRKIVRAWATNPEMDRHHLVFQALDGTPILSIDQPRQGLKAAAPTVYGRGGTSVGRIGLAPQSRPGEPHISLNIRAADGERLGDVRYLGGPTSFGGPTDRGVYDHKGRELARIRGGRGYGRKSFGYDLTFADDLTDPLRSLVTAAPIVLYVMLHM